MTVNAKSAFDVMLRLEAGGEYLTRATTSSITWGAYPAHAALDSSPIASGTLTVSTSVFDEFQTDGRWTEDAIGYNCRHTVGATVFEDGGEYVIQYTVTPSGGNPYRVPVSVSVKGVFGS
jgi:hypothetical protein